MLMYINFTRLQVICACIQKETLGGREMCVRVCTYDTKCLHTGTDALEWQRKLSHKVVPVGPPVFVHHPEPHNSQLRELHHKMEDLVPDRIET